MDLTVVLSQLQVLMSHLWEFKEKKGRKEEGIRKRREEGIKKERRNFKKKKKRKEPPAGFKKAKPVLLVFLAAAG